jgi:hypothetical protein
MTTIDLYEDNAGGLYLHCVGGKTVWVVGGMGSTFGEDCAGMVELGTGDWTADSLPASDILGRQGEASSPILIATWQGGDITFVRNDYSGSMLAGSAGREYLGLPRRGGPREGAGRPPLPLDAQKVRVDVRLTQAEVAQARALGGGNLSEGIRRALEQTE